MYDFSDLLYLAVILRDLWLDGMLTIEEYRSGVFSLVED